MDLLKSEFTIKNLDGKTITDEEITYKKLKELDSFILLERKNLDVKPHSNFKRRFEEIISLTDPILLYSDFYYKDEKIEPPLFSRGSVRDNFYFGNIFLLNTIKSIELMEKFFPSPEKIKFSTLYLILLLSILRGEKILKIKEPLYTVWERGRNSHFEYTYKNLEIQRERENVLNFFLKKKGAYIKNTLPFFPKSKFPILASVVIPVKNREKTIKDAILSAISQKTNFKFNVIVINNHSRDKTGEIVEKLSKKYSNLYHIIPEEKNLNIGGCWQLAVNSEMCGKYVIQLDSDDIYSHENVIERIVEKFESEKCGMVVGSYMVVDFNLNPLIDGVISHKEWSEENGHNNLLRVNGIGAPRAFVTEILRNEFQFPDVSYGEDYYISLAISGKYKIGRILDSLYLCRRWKGNTDSHISENTMYRFDEYKDFLREMEIERRIKRNRKE